MELSVSDVISIVLSVLSFILAAISVITVVITLRQNNKMLEASFRPYIVVKYEHSVTHGGVSRYVVVKNYGQTGARITSVSNVQYNGRGEDDLVDRILRLNGLFLAPSQSILNYVGDVESEIEEYLQLDLEYSAGNKTYSESIHLPLIDGALSSRSNSEYAISYALQDIAERLL